MDPSRVKERLEAQCARREYCSSDVLRKAAELLAKEIPGQARNDSDNNSHSGRSPKGGDPESTTAEQIVAELVRDGFVDDSRYAQAFAREKSRLTGWGPIKIRQALQVKKIPREIISEALAAAAGEDADSRLEKLLAAKARTLEGAPQARLKLIRFALSRGYEYDAVQKALRD